jgi:hypothetical protein
MPQVRRADAPVAEAGFPRYGRNGYFEAGCSNCDFGEHRDMFVAVPDMATAVALVYLYDLAGKPL